jgi:hypothetical protein
MLPQLKAAIIRALYKKLEEFPDLYWLSFIKNFDLASALIACDDDFCKATESLVLTEEQSQQMLSLRGLLGRKVLEHCLERRHRVDYGTAKRYGCLHP